jgi:flagellar hook protein FlgE
MVEDNTPKSLEVIRLNPNRSQVQATDRISISVNLPSNVDIIPDGQLPSQNNVGSTANASTSFTAYDNLGNAVVINCHFAKTGENNWELAIYDSTKKGGEPFPYTDEPLQTQTLSFNAHGRIEGQDELLFQVPGGGQAKISLQDSTQLSGPFVLMSLTANGNPLSANGRITIDDNGYIRYSNGEDKATYRIPLASCAAPNYMDRLNGSSFSISAESGPILVGYSNEGSIGTLRAGFLESSTIDLGQELTDMLQAQRNYAANSKVFKSSGDMLEILLGLKS